MRRRRTAVPLLMLLISTVPLLWAVAAPRRSAPYPDYALRTSHVPMPAPFPPTRRIAVSVTAYSSTPDQTWGDPFLAYCGPVGPGTVALSHDLFEQYPCGTVVALGGRKYIVNDLMHPRWRLRADVWMSSRGAALRHGVRHDVTMEVPIR